MQIGLTRVLPLAHDSAVAVAAGRGEVVDAEDRDGGRATPSDAPSAPELRLSRRLERSRGRRTRRWRYAPSRFDFSDAPPVLGERGGQRSCSSLVWLGGGSGRWRRLRCRRSRGGVQTTTRVRRKGLPEETTCPGRIWGVQGLWSSPGWSGELLSAVSAGPARGPTRAGVRTARVGRVTLRERGSARVTILTNFLTKRR